MSETPAMEMAARAIAYCFASGHSKILDEGKVLSWVEHSWPRYIPHARACVGVYLEEMPVSDGMVEVISKHVWEHDTADVKPRAVKAVITAALRHAAKEGGAE